MSSFYKPRVDTIYLNLDRELVAGAKRQTPDVVGGLKSEDKKLLANSRKAVDNSPIFKKLI
jgi:hypothetical protein